MVPFAYEQFIGNLTEMVKSGAIPMSRIDDAVTRILRVKFQMGLFERPYGDYKLKKIVGQEVISRLHCATYNCTDCLIHAGIINCGWAEYVRTLYMCSHTEN